MLMTQRNADREQPQQQRRVAAAEQAWDDWALWTELSRQARTWARVRAIPFREEVRDATTQIDDDGERASGSGDRRPPVDDGAETKEWPPQQRKEISQATTPEGKEHARRAKQQSLYNVMEKIMG